MKTCFILFIKYIYLFHLVLLAKCKLYLLNLAIYITKKLLKYLIYYVRGKIMASP